MSRIYLSPPHMSARELELLRRAFESNWIAPVGPDLDAFEAEFAALLGVPRALALASGTAALHLAVRLAGVGPGDEVLCSTLTFAATAFAVTYQGAEPVFVDASEESWNLAPELLRGELERRAESGELPKAAIVVDLYGQSADWEPILAACREHGVAVIEDAAESLGASYRQRPVGTFGDFGVFSFNGNKIITTSGGGMLVSSDGEAIARARHLATQARDPAPHYQHSTIGYNYRLSNLLAAVGRGQLEVLEERVAARRRNFSIYQELLGDLPGLTFMPEAHWGRSTRWLTCLTLEPELFGAARDQVLAALEAEEIEARPVWKPMHLQPVFRDRGCVGGSVAERIFERGLCLPSGSSLRRRDIERICGLVRRQCRAEAGA